MKAAIIDLETTGLLKHPRAKAITQPRCIEFGAVVINHKGEQLDTMSQLIYPDQKIESVITKITGITNNDLKGKPRFAEVYEDITKLICSCDAVIAHNLPFDKGVLYREFAMLWLETGAKDLVWPAIQLCTVQENVPVYGYRIKLKDLYKDVTGQSWTQKHRALDDCKALAEVVIQEGYLEMLG